MRAVMSLPLKLFAAAAAVDVAAAASGLSGLHWIARPLLAPLLIWHLARARGTNRPDAVVYALVFAAAGDVALLIPHTAGLLAGMLFFLVALVSLTLGFLNRAKPLPAPSAFFALLSVSANALFGEQLGALRVPVLFYSLALAAMAAAAAGVTPMIAAGGALFLVSDVLFGATVAGVQVTAAAAATHAAALALIVIGWAQPRELDFLERGGVKQPVRRPRTRTAYDTGGGVVDDRGLHLSR
jgi:uncharacterized membrane protein YhhN